MTVLRDALLPLLAAALLAGIALHQVRRARRLESALVDARLAALAMQLRPHFLLNALNAAAELVRTDAESADRMLTALGRLLSHALRSDGRRLVALREELALLQQYVAIEQLRFGDRLVVEWAIAPPALAARVPPLLLQPLVENAVRHGIAPRAALGFVRIVATREGDALRLVVSDDGVGFGEHDATDHDRAAHVGVGLANVRARLHALYGARHSIDVASRPGTGTVVTVRLPWRVEREPRRAIDAPVAAFR